MGDDDLGVELPLRRGVVRSLLAIAGVGAAFTLWLLTDTLEGGSLSQALTYSGIAALVAVVLPLAAARFFRRLAYFVSDAAVTQVLGGRVWRQIEFHELTEIRVTRDYGRVGLSGPRTSSPALRLRGVDDRGRSTGLIVSEQLLRSLRPLLQRVAGEAARRPELIRDPRESALLREFLQAG